jgi:hypothetical protein
MHAGVVHRRHTQQTHPEVVGVQRSDGATDCIRLLVSYQRRWPASGVMSGPGLAQRRHSIPHGRHQTWNAGIRGCDVHCRHRTGCRMAGTPTGVDVVVLHGNTRLDGNWCGGAAHKAQHAWDHSSDADSLRARNRFGRCALLRHRRDVTPGRVTIPTACIP